MAIGSLPPSSAPDGSRIVTASYDDTAHIWDAATGKVIAVLPGSAVSAAFSPDGSRIVTGEPTEGAVHIWAVATGKGIAVMRGHVVLSAAFSPDGSRIVTASEDQTARIWDAATGKSRTAWSSLRTRENCSATSSSLRTLGQRTSRVSLGACEPSQRCGQVRRKVASRRCTQPV